MNQIFNGYVGQVCIQGYKCMWKDAIIPDIHKRRELYFLHLTSTTDIHGEVGSTVKTASDNGEGRSERIIHLQICAGCRAAVADPCHCQHNRIRTPVRSLVHLMCEDEAKTWAGLETQWWGLKFEGSKIPKWGNSKQSKPVSDEDISCAKQPSRHRTLLMTAKEREVRWWMVEPLRPKPISNRAEWIQLMQRILKRTTLWSFRIHRGRAQSEFRLHVDIRRELGSGRFSGKGAIGTLLKTFSLGFSSNVYRGLTQVCTFKRTAISNLEKYKMCQKKVHIFAHLLQDNKKFWWTCCCIHVI